MKRHLILVAAALAFAACAEKAQTDNQSQELDKSYVSITLAANDGSTKAAGDSYEDGLTAERKVESAYVFFFKDGAAFPINFNSSTSTSSNTGNSNYIAIDLSGSQSGTPNVSDIKDAVLILQKYKGEYPDQVVAVLNWDPTAQASYTLNELKSIVTDLGNATDGFVMSNSVYAGKGEQTIDAVNLTISNIAKTEADALANPVTIYVERAAAKVAFTSTNNGKFNVGKEVDGTPVYAQITGFELYNDYENSKLIKSINPAWESIGFSWNDPDWFRSYWAQSIETAFPNNTFGWNTDNTAINGFVYCGENTRQWSEQSDVRTKVIIKAQLVDANGTAVEVVNWYGKDYVGEGTLKTVVANTLKNVYFSGSNQTYTGLTPEDIKCVSRVETQENAYEVYFQLSDAGMAKTWYKYENGNYTSIAQNASLNTVLASLQPALVYKNGMTYYWTDIKHLGNTGSTTEYGVVRNHVYKVNITSISGFGTPVYSTTLDFLKPEKPSDVISYVSAQVNILSWRIVDNNYDID